MKGLLDIKRLIIGAVFAATFLLIGSSDVSAQSRREIERERQRIERERERNQRAVRRSGVTRRMENRVNNANFTNGYNYGFMAGQYDRRKNKYNQSNVYRDSGSYPNDGDPTSSDYIYRQGYLEGYNDGFNGRRNY